MARRGSFRLEFDSGRITQIGRRLSRAEMELFRRCGEGLVEEVRSNIRSRSGALARSWRWRRNGGWIELRTSSRYGRASVKGAYIKPKRKKVLAFRVAGQTVFARAVRLTPGSYVGNPGGHEGYLDEAVKEFGPIVRDAFGKSYGSLKRF
jgi:hypothetical protein